MFKFNQTCLTLCERLDTTIGMDKHHGKTVTMFQMLLVLFKLSCIEYA